MSGNVWEWVWDWGGDYPEESVQDPQGPSSGSDRVIRGGSWNRDAKNARVSYRLGFLPVFGHDYLGFRLARSAP
jgi:formylglycine-generating enzyme required for sulfatase activity